MKLLVHINKIICCDNRVIIAQGLNIESTQELFARFKSKPSLKVKRSFLFGLAFRVVAPPHSNRFLLIWAWCPSHQWNYTLQKLLTAWVLCQERQLRGV